MDPAVKRTKNVLPIAKFQRIALLLLAAGHARRFGGQKLLAPLAGRPLAHHAAVTLAALPFGRKVAVTGSVDLGLSQFGFTCVAVRGEDYPMSVSLAHGIEAVAGSEAVMIALADMPFVPPAHIVRLAERFRGSRIASSNGKNLMPPAIFGAQWFGRLGSLSGDNGARSLLHGAPHILADAVDLTDIDSARDMMRAEQGKQAR